MKAGNCLLCMLILIINLQYLSAQENNTLPKGSDQQHGKYWLRGKITYTDGMPVRGATVLLDASSAFYRSAQTDSAGGYAFEGLWARVQPSVTIEIITSIERQAQFSRKSSIQYQFQFIKSNVIKDFQIQRANKYLKGKVVDENGTPLAEYLVRIEGIQAEGTPVIVSSFTDKKGNFKIDYLASRRIDLSISSKIKGIWIQTKTFKDVETNTKHVFVLKKTDRIEWPPPKTFVKSKRDSQASFLRKRLLALQNKPAPAFVIENWIQGKPVDQKFKNKVVVLHFWSFKEPYCIDQLPFVSVLHEAYHSEGVVCISLHEYTASIDGIMSLIKEKHLKQSIAIDQPSKDQWSCGIIYDLFGVVYSSKPSFIVIDKKRNVHAIFRDYEVVEEIQKNI